MTHIARTAEEQPRRVPPVGPPPSAPTALRQIRTRHLLSQAQLAGRLDVSVETLRLWDSGRRQTPDAVIALAERLLSDPDEPLFALRQLAATFDVHVRTLRAAARDGRLSVTFANRAFFGRPVAVATRTAVTAFLAGGYGKSRTTVRAVPPLAPVPDDCGPRIIGIRRRLGVSQGELARRVGAAGRAVVYQWETGKRRPSAVFWTRLLKLRKRGPDAARLHRGPRP
jgi:DNA-binding transcriptional regulator YiaG